MKALSRILSVGLIFMTGVACATTTRYYDGMNGETSSMDAAIERVRSGTVVIISEHHGFAPHHENQRKILRRLGELGRPVSVGLEFFNYPFQPLVDLYLKGELTEEDFLVGINWGRISFEHYREQALFPLDNGGKTLAINAPREVTRNLSKGGLDGLAPEQRRLLPPNFTLGNDFYKERFVEAMGNHIPEEKMDFYFQAQSAWDDTMAWRVAEFMREHPEHIFVIIVGDFHAAYFGGLPDRLKARGVQDLLVISQVDHQDSDQKELEEDVLPHPKYGPRADFVFSIEN